MRRCGSETRRAVLGAVLVEAGLGHHVDPVMLAGDELAAGRADAVLEAERGAVLGRPFRARRRPSSTNGMRSFSSRGRLRREQVGRHPRQVEMAIGRNAVVLHASLPYCRNCARRPAGTARARFRQSEGGSHGKDDGTDRDRHRREPRHRPGDRRALRPGGRKGGLRRAHPERGRSPARGLARQHRGRHPRRRAARRRAVAADISSEAECLQAGRGGPRRLWAGSTPW